LALVHQRSVRHSGEFYYYRARWYDPQARQFISEDPIGLDGGINLYAYVGNNPVNFSDPSGNGKVKFFKVITVKLEQYGKRGFFKKVTNIELSEEEAIRRFDIGEDIFTSKSKAEKIAMDGALEDPAHVGPGREGECRKHFHDKDRKKGHAFFGPDENVDLSVIGSTLGVDLLGDNLAGQAVDFFTP
jgi:RHS repeat-associated protein